MPFSPIQLEAQKRPKKAVPIVVTFPWGPQKHQQQQAFLLSSPQ